MTCPECEARKQLEQLTAWVRAREEAGEVIRAGSAREVMQRLGLWRDNGDGDAS